MTTSQKNLRVLIVAEHASAKFGGEAVLPLHYYRVLRKRNIPVWLVVHERTRTELLKLYPNDIDRIFFVPDTRLHRFLWSVGTKLPNRVANFTVGFLMRMASQIVQRQVIKRLITEVGINIVHQPMPVSPKEPSLLFNLGVPVVIGPMNGGMDYPPAFRGLQSMHEALVLMLARSLSCVLNTIFPGKKKASLLLVANTRTQKALPNCLHKVRTNILVENGVDLSLWADHRPLVKEADATVRFVYMGRLVDWKAVDILINAFAIASQKASMTLSIIGDGDQREALELQARSLGVLGENLEVGKVHFLGWKAQLECAQYLQSSDALVLTSLMECGGAVVLEAMAMSLPVIATNWGGPADYIDETCGILVQPSNRDAFTLGVAEAFCRLAENPEEGKAMGRAGYARVKEEFDWEIKVDRMVEIYQNEVHAP